MTQISLVGFSLRFAFGEPLITLPSDLEVLLGQLHEVSRHQQCSEIGKVADSAGAHRHPPLGSQ